MGLKVEQYYLDLKKVNKIKSETERGQIHRYYADMMYAVNEGRNQMAVSIMMTLLRGGYLVDCREKKLNHLLNEK